MRTIETTAVVNADHTVTLTLPEDIPPGPVKLVLVVEAEPAPPPAPARLTDGWHLLDVGPWPEGFTVSREQIYDDDGR